jgi:Fic family protein
MMEPLRIGEDSKHRTSLSDLAFELAHKAGSFRGSLAEGIRTPLCDLVRNMNCYYSNLIEGHDTHPIDIERALNNDYSSNAEKRNLQLEAKSHIAVQKWIDSGGLRQRYATVSGLCEIHKRFIDGLPDDLQWVKIPNSDKMVRVRPGKFRDDYVNVDLHIPVSPGAVPRFMARFEQAYAKLSPQQAVLQAAAAHHRLAWIHPFSDGNGRVTRLMSHAMLSEALDTGGVWSIARGLARRKDEYRKYLANCDLQRRNDFDGRGNLSEEALAVFTRFFLELCLDQVSFMESLMEPKVLRNRIIAWAEERVRFRELTKKAIPVLEALLFRGELARGDVPEVMGSAPRTAQVLMQSLQGLGVVTSPHSKAPWRIAFPAALAYRWMPNLFPLQQ